MNLAVKIFKIFAAMADHRSREGGQRFSGNFDWAGSEKLVVNLHQENVERPTSNVQCRNRKRQLSTLRVGFDEADVATAFETRNFDFHQLFGLGGESEIFLEVVIGY